MKSVHTTLAALAATLVAAPALTTTADAHRRGDVCRYQSIDRYGDVRKGSDYCHHLPARYQQRPRSGLTLYFDFGDGFYFDDEPRRRDRHRHGRRGDDRPRGDSEELVCLVTFFERDQVQGGADADVERARILPRREAERRDRPNDRKRIFDYGSNRQTRETCRYLNGINN